MFNFFKRSGKEKLDKDIHLMKSICAQLPAEFEYLKKQVEEGIIIGVKSLNKAPYVNYESFSLAVDLLNKYENKKGRTFVVRGISVWDTQSNAFTEIQLQVAFGLLLGYIHPDRATIDLDSFRIKMNAPFAI